MCPCCRAGHSLAPHRALPGELLQGGARDALAEFMQDLRLDLLLIMTTTQTPTFARELALFTLPSLRYSRAALQRYHGEGTCPRVADGQAHCVVSTRCGADPELGFGLGAASAGARGTGVDGLFPAGPSDFPQGAAAWRTRSGPQRVVVGLSAFCRLRSGVAASRCEGAGGHTHAAARAAQRAAGWPRRRHWVWQIHRGDAA
jgi:hypothetical protein